MLIKISQIPSFIQKQLYAMLTEISGVFNHSISLRLQSAALIYSQEARIFFIS